MTLRRAVGSTWANGNDQSSTLRGIALARATSVPREHVHHFSAATKQPRPKWLA